MKTVGVFDSGVGGLSVLQALLAEMPDTHFIYVADSAHAPYGERSAQAVCERTHAITAHLRDAHAIDALVIACNTATAHAIDGLRPRQHDLPIVGVEPALKPAVALSCSGHIGVFATRGTLGSARFVRLRDRLATSASRALNFHCQPCDGLADAIERHDMRAIERLCERYVYELQYANGGAQPIDTLVLGCTHYPFAAKTLRRLIGPDVRLVDTGAPVARRTREVLVLPASTSAMARMPTLLSTGEPTALAQAAQRWLGLGVGARGLHV